MRALRKLRAITRQTPTYSFPSAAGQSTGSSSASGRPPRCHSRSTRTCFAMRVGSSWPLMATIRGRCSTTSGTRTSSTRLDTRKWRQTASRTFGGTDFRTPPARCCRLRRAAEHIAGMPTRPFHDPAVRVAGTGKPVPPVRHRWLPLVASRPPPPRSYSLMISMAWFNCSSVWHQHCADFQIRIRRLAPNPEKHLFSMRLKIVS